jgi:hypothetical protein
MEFQYLSNLDSNSCSPLSKSPLPAPRSHNSLAHSAYCRVMTIAVCDMLSEDVAAQMVLWKNLNDIMARLGVPELKFKGFMADSAQAN